MNSESKPLSKQPAKPSGIRYDSVEALMKGEGVPAEIQKEFDRLKKESQIADQLAALRQVAGLTQKQMGERLGLSQSAISKIEMEPNDNLTLGIMRGYAQATRQRIGLFFGKPMNHVESVKNHALAIKHHLSELAKLAHHGEDFQKEISAFFGEAFFNILSILSECSQEMPHKDFEIRFQAIATRASRSTPPRKTIEKTTPLIPA